MVTKIDEHGITVTRRYVGGARHVYDYRHCRREDGWRRYDTEHEAWAFGIWVHIERREIVTFAHGDEIRVTCPNDDALRARLTRIAKHHGPPRPAFAGFDMEPRTDEQTRATGEKEGG